MAAPGHRESEVVGRHSRGKSSASRRYCTPISFEQAITMQRCNEMNLLQYLQHASCILSIIDRMEVDGGPKAKPGAS
jgi:hypothetical protein